MEPPRDRDKGGIWKGGGQSAVSPDVRECINKNLERGAMHYMRNTTIRNQLQISYSHSPVCINCANSPPLATSSSKVPSSTTLPPPRHRILSHLLIASTEWVMNTVVRDYHQLKAFLGFHFGQFLDFMNNTVSGRGRLTDHKLVGEKLN